MNEDKIYTIEPTKPLMPPAIELGLLVLMMLFCLLVGQGLSLLVAEVNGIDFNQILSAEAASSTKNERNFMRLLALISNSFSFIVPAFVFSLVRYRELWAKKLGFTTRLKSMWMPMMLLFTVGGFFFSQFTYWLNQMLPLPDWATRMEEQTGGLIETILNMQSSGEFLLTLFVVAVVPALGEELVFRGLVQRRLQEITQKPHLAIFITALVFSFIHFQFAGFLPRMVLGGVLGYLFYWTGNLWMPIIAHFLINGLQVVAAYIGGASIDSLQNQDLASAEPLNMFGLAAFSLVLIYFSGSWFSQQKRKE